MFSEVNQYLSIFIILNQYYSVLIDIGFWAQITIIICIVQVTYRLLDYDCRPPITVAVPVHTDDDNNNKQQQWLKAATMEPVTRTPKEMLRGGLCLMGWSIWRINRAKFKTNLRRFRCHFGSHPKVLALVYEELQTTAIEAARIEPSIIDVDDFFAAVHFLKRYPTEIERECLFGLPAKTIRKRTWNHVFKLRALKAAKITFPTEFHPGDCWILSVDGTNCLINEPIHPELSMDPDYYSHKHHDAGFSYELGISLYESRLIWMNGPFKAHENDNGIFQSHGLKEKLQQVGKKALGDRAYAGHFDTCSVYNNLDSDELKVFKSRVQMRHETFNGLLKQYACLNHRFRHGVHDSKFAACFEACAVLCQYRIECDEPLFEL